MAVDVTLTEIVSGYNVTKINDNFAALEVALQDAVSRSGSTPNTLSADLDLNSNDLLNVADVHTTRLFVNGTQFVASSVEAVGDKGWAPVFAVVENGANRVLQLVDYVGGEGDKPTDNINDYVSDTGYTSTIGDATNIRGATGASGPGSGDLLAANNLDDVASAATAFSNIKQAASTTATGVVELATNAEAVTGTDTARAVTPAGVAAAIDDRLAGGYSYLGRQVFTSSGSYTPTAGATFIKVRMVAGGGGGGGARSGTSGEGAAAAASGGGGGEGADFEMLVSALTTPVTVTIGAAGSAGSSSGGDGSAGGSTSFGAYASVNGGNGGDGKSGGYSGADARAGGSGGSVPSGGLLFPGGDSHPAVVGDGGTGSQAIKTMAGNGGNSIFGFGGAGNFTDGTSHAGDDGHGFGAGGGGACSKSSTGAAGGAGTAGLMIIEEYTSG